MEIFSCNLFGSSKRKIKARTPKHEKFQDSHINAFKGHFKTFLITFERPLMTAMTLNQRSSRPLKGNVSGANFITPLILLVPPPGKRDQERGET